LLMDALSEKAQIIIHIIFILLSFCRESRES